VLVSASAVGYYGGREETALTESCGSGADFPAALCRAWEREALHAQALGIRVVVLRLGLVLGDGGLLAQLRPVFRLGLGAVLGSGRQWMAWLHLDDAVELIAASIDDCHAQSIVNAVSPEPVTQAQFAAALARALHRPLWLRVPAWCLRLLLGELSTLLIDGQRAVPQSLQQGGYCFRFPSLAAALADLLRPARTRAQNSRRLRHA
jgi:uncharacterized protein (TIGR01777 family)